MLYLYIPSSVLELNYSVKGEEVYVHDKNIDFIFIPSMVWREELHQLSSIWTGLKLQLPRFKDHYLELQILCATMNILFFFLSSRQLTTTSGWSRRIGYAE